MRKAPSPGATDKHAGKFAEANGGTLFLDEIGELPPEAQVKLLRALQEGEIDPVGSRRPVKVDFRLVSATNKNLIELVKAGRFREDLFYRLNVFPISIPPLRARLCDVQDLAVRFLARFCVEEGKRIRGIANDALALLTAYDWPGNVRQLENAMFRAVVLADGDELTTPSFLRSRRRSRATMCAFRPPRLRSPPIQRLPSVSGRPLTTTAIPHSLQNDQRQRRRAHAGGDRNRGHSLRALPLSRTNVANGAQARHRALDALPQDERHRDRR